MEVENLIDWKIAGLKNRLKNKKQELIRLENAMSYVQDDYNQILQQINDCLREKNND